ncbi:MAG: hypothetical protein JOZ04_04620 [Acidimicrobiia bacterium]|nr:hypothetical protein [Acidimicrobiia bacterium]
MGGIPRRAFIGRGVLGAAAVGVAAPMLPALVGIVAGEAPEAGDATADVSAVESGVEPLVARVRDAATGEIELFLGERQVIYHDPDLAARLVRAAR